MSPNEPQGSAAQHTSAVERAVDQIRDNLDTIVRNLNAGIDTANSAWFLLSPPAQLWMARSINALHEAFDKVLVIAREVMAHYQPVVSLINISFHWLDAVKKPISNMAPTVDAWAIKDLAYWEGGTATHYNDKVLPVQKDATDALSQKAGFVSEWLYGIALANVTYVTELSKVIATILGEVTTAALEAATIIDIPWALDRLAAAVGATVETGTSNLLGIVQRIVEAGERVRKTVSDTVDHSKFPGGSWPEAVRG